MTFTVMAPTFPASNAFLRQQSSYKMQPIAQISVLLSYGRPCKTLWINPISLTNQMPCVLQRIAITSFVGLSFLRHKWYWYADLHICRIRFRCDYPNGVKSIFQIPEHMVITKSSQKRRKSQRQLIEDFKVTRVNVCWVWSRHDLI